MFGLFSRKQPFVATLPDGQRLTVKAGDNLLKAALDAGIAWPHNCRVGSCGECRTRLVSGKIKPLNDFSYVLSKEEMDAGMILACQSCLRSDIEVDVKVDSGVTLNKPESSPGWIIGYQLLTHDILELRIRLNKPVQAHLPGQYAELSIPGVIEEPRSYSFATAPSKADVDTVTFFIRMVPGGRMTGWLHESDRTGTKVEVNGPFGNFWLRDSEKPAIFICGGSGLAPIMALLEQVSATGFERDITLIFGARAQRDLYCVDDIEDIAHSAGKRFKYLPVLSDEPPDSGWTGLRGFCTELIAECIVETGACEAYLCGPPGMVDAAIDVLHANNVNDDSIFFDKFLDSSHAVPNKARVAGV